MAAGASMSHLGTPQMTNAELVAVFEAQQTPVLTNKDAETCTSPGGNRSSSSPIENKFLCPFPGACPLSDPSSVVWSPPRARVPSTSLPAPPRVVDRVAVHCLSTVACNPTRLGGSMSAAQSTSWSFW